MFRPIVSGKSAPNQMMSKFIFSVLYSKLTPVQSLSFLIADVFRVKCSALGLWQFFLKRLALRMWMERPLYLADVLLF